MPGRGQHLLFRILHAHYTITGVRCGRISGCACEAGVMRQVAVALALAGTAAMTRHAPDRHGANVPAPERLQSTRADTDTVTTVRDSLMNSVLQSIAGRENLPADSVFANVKTLGAFPAGRFVRVMSSFGRALGVTCAHCHTVGKWNDDGKPQKQIAREMWAMMGRINTELLPAIPNLRSPRPIVNCTTCHRGQVKPALDFP
jgi:hypothetical protein